MRGCEDLLKITRFAKHIIFGFGSAPQEIAMTVFVNQEFGAAGAGNQGNARHSYYEEPRFHLPSFLLPDNNALIFSFISGPSHCRSPLIFSLITPSLSMRKL